MMSEAAIFATTIRKEYIIPQNVDAAEVDMMMACMNNANNATQLGIYLLIFFITVIVPLITTISIVVMLKMLLIIAWHVIHTLIEF